MERILELSFLELTEEERAFHLSFIPPQFFYALSYLFQSTAEQSKSATLKAFITIEEESPLCLAIVKITPVLRLADLEFLYTPPHVRKQGVATRLLTFIEQRLKENHLLVFQALYPDQEEWSQDATDLFAKLGWKQVHKPLFLDLIFDALTFRPNWMYQTKPLSSEDWEFFLWENLKLEERQSIQHQLHQGQISSTFSPFKGPFPFHPETSLGLRHQGKLIGWNITHLTTPQTVRYSILYVDAKYRYQGPGIQLLITALQTQALLCETYPHALCEVPLNKVPDSWIRFIEKKLIPYSKQVHHRYRVWKQLGLKSDQV